MLLYTYSTNNNCYSKQNIAYLINGIDYNLRLIIVFILHCNVSVLRCIMCNTSFVEMTWIPW